VQSPPWLLRALARGGAGALALALLAVLALASAASGSIAVATGSFADPTLAVDRNGKARVSWTENGTRRALYVPPTGQVAYSGGLAGPDVSRSASAPGLRLALVVRRTPDGMLWALQRWALPGRRVELHLARWRGTPTKLALRLEGNRLRGSASFQGRPATGFSATPAGKRMRIYVYLDCFGCAARANGWTAMLGVAPRSDGGFSVWLRPAWQGERYRATIAGPNVGATRAPDAQVVVSATP
jgi:hypothetical protein